MRSLCAAAALVVLSLPDIGRADDPPQFRAFWVDGFNPGFKTPDQVRQLVADLKAMNCNAVIAQVRKRGDALFRRSVEPFAEDKSVPNGFDPLGALIEAAHAERIQVHAWVNVSTIWPGSAKPPVSPDHVFNKHGPGSAGKQDWLSRDDAGRYRFASGHFADPGHPDYAEHFTRVVRELVREYPVDGIHFDFVRYSEKSGPPNPGGEAGYNPTNVERFNRAHGRAGLPDPADPAWKAWRRQQVSLLVRRLRVALLEDKPDVLVSAALIPWGDGPADEDGWYRSAPYTRVYQDWHNWRKAGFLDFIVPMNYDRDALPAQKAYFDHWIAFEKRYRGRALTVVGVGAYMNSVPDTVSQIKRALAAEGGVGGADGVCFYRHGYAGPGKEAGFRDDFRELRRLLVEADAAPFHRPAAPPTPPRLNNPTEGVIAGRATDADGTTLDTHLIIIEPAAGGPPGHCVTDGNGHFALLGLAPGKYRLAVPVRGSALPRVVDVNAGRVTRVKE